MEEGNMRRTIGLVLLTLGLVFTGFADQKAKNRYAIVLLAGNETNEGKVRAAHALLYAVELAEKGYSVVLIFDGAGAGWANEFNKPENPLYKPYLKLQKLGVVEEICDHCSKNMGVQEKLSERQKKSIVSDYKGHPSLVKWVERGYQILTL